LKRDHRPYYIKKIYLMLERFYVNHFLRPQFEFLGKDVTFIKPWHVEIFGGPVSLGNCANVIATTDRKVRLSVWPPHQGAGSIQIGNYCLICPGVRIGSGCAITIGDNCMIASNAYLTDGDWHDLYDRVSPGKGAPITLGRNVWIGDNAIICKGVTIGQNSIIGAGSVVTSDIPPNSVAAGNPASVVKQLDPDKPLTERSQWFSDPLKLERDIDQIDRVMLGENTFSHWLRHLFAPRKGE